MNITCVSLLGVITGTKRYRLLIVTLILLAIVVKLKFCKSFVFNVERNPNFFVHFLNVSQKPNRGSRAS